MKKSILDKIFDMSDRIDSSITSTVINEVVELLCSNQLEEAVQIKRLLDDETINMYPEDLKSYNLGRIHAVIEFVNCLSYIENLNNLEKN